MGDGKSKRAYSFIGRTICRNLGQICHRISTFPTSPFDTKGLSNSNKTFMKNFETLLGIFIVLLVFFSASKIIFSESEAQESRWSFEAKESERCAFDEGYIHCVDKETGESTRYIGQPSAENPYGWEMAADKDTIFIDGEGHEVYQDFTITMPLSIGDRIKNKGHEIVYLSLGGEAEVEKGIRLNPGTEFYISFEIYQGISPWPSGKRGLSAIADGGGSVLVKYSE